VNANKESFLKIINSGEHEDKEELFEEYVSNDNINNSKCIDDIEDIGKKINKKRKKEKKKKEIQYEFIEEGNVRQKN